MSIAELQPVMWSNNARNGLPVLVVLWPLMIVWRWRRLGRGDVVSFPRGEGGAHQIVNRGSAPARFLAVSTNGDPDVVLYPDSGKLGVAERLPRGGGLSEYYRREDAVSYWEGETPPDPA